MPKLTITLETVTPLFIAGAQPRGTPELRPPAFRGALRYWLRAALGGVYGDSADGLEQVRKAEAAVFGSTEAKLGGASAVALQIVPKASYTPQPYDRSKSPTGRDYLYWSMTSSGSQERGNFQDAKKFLPAGTRFDLTLSLRPGATDGAQAMRQAVAALWLLVHLGGVGSRSRRTAGSLSVSKPEKVDDLGFVLSARTIKEATEQMGLALGLIRSRFLPAQANGVGVPSEFDVLHPKVCRIWVLGVWPKPDLAVEEIGTALRVFRSRREPDHANVARWLQGEKIPSVERAAFGLPIPYRYSGGGPFGTIQATGIDRRASPLWLHISRIGSGQYVGVATLFKSRFLAQGTKLQAKTRGSSPPVDPPSDYSLIERWVADAFRGCEEVTYA